jgi:acetylornithine deacetylase/succinyl-diaminopimelate desuccinylase-like protein
MENMHSFGRSSVILFAAALLLSRSMSAQVSDATKQLARDIFRELIEINTTDSTGDNTAAAHAVEKRLLNAGFAREDVKVLVPGGRATKGNLVVRLRGPKAGTLQPVLLLGHLDVVEAKREDWTTNPFEFVEKDGYFYGRGTEDMKDFDAVMITAFIRFKQEGYTPSRDLILALTSDEEGGTANGVDWLLKNHRDLLEAAFVLNGDAGGVTTEKGKAIDVADTVPAPRRRTPSTGWRRRWAALPMRRFRLSSIP